MSSRLLLLPGLEGTGRLFAPLRAALTDDLEPAVMVYGDEQLFEEYLETVAAHMAETDTVLVAESFSGPIALALMSRYPARIRCAVLCATFAVSPFRHLCIAASVMPAWSFRPGMLRDTLIRHFALNGETHHGIDQEVMAVTRIVPGTVTKSRLALLARVNVLPLLADIPQPILYLQASDDRVVSRRLSKQLIDRLPRVEHQIIEGPHMLAQTRPLECARAIEDFLRTH